MALKLRFGAKTKCTNVALTAMPTIIQHMNFTFFDSAAYPPLLGFTKPPAIADAAKIRLLSRFQRKPPIDSFPHHHNMGAAKYDSMYKLIPYAGLMNASTVRMANSASQISVGPCTARHSSLTGLEPAARACLIQAGVQLLVAFHHAAHTVALSESCAGAAPEIAAKLCVACQHLDGGGNRLG